MPSLGTEGCASVCVCETDRQRLRGICETFYKKVYLFIFIFGCAGSSLLHGLFSSCDKQGATLAVVCWLLIAEAFLVAELGFQGTRASAVAARGL